MTLLEVSVTFVTFEYAPPPPPPPGPVMPLPKLDAPPPPPPPMVSITLFELFQFEGTVRVYVPGVEYVSSWPLHWSGGGAVQVILTWPEAPGPTLVPERTPAAPTVIGTDTPGVRSPMEYVFFAYAPPPPPAPLSQYHTYSVFHPPTHDHDLLHESYTYRACEL